jgi:hypothetical protein
MDAEKTIAQIEWLEELFRLPDERMSRVLGWKPGIEKRAEDCASDMRFLLRRRNNR